MYKGLLSLWKTLKNITALSTYLKQHRTLQLKTKMCMLYSGIVSSVYLIYTNTQQGDKVGRGGGSSSAGDSAPPPLVFNKQALAWAGDGREKSTVPLGLSTIGKSLSWVWF